jgi:hypothetical protein
MNPKDTICIAGLLRTARSEYDDPGGAIEAAIDGIAADLAHYFAAVDPDGFKPECFLRAAGLRAWTHTAERGGA